MPAGLNSVGQVTVFDVQGREIPENDYICICTEGSAIGQNSFLIVFD